MLAGSHHRAFSWHLLPQPRLWAPSSAGDLPKLLLQPSPRPCWGCSPGLTCKVTSSQVIIYPLADSMQECLGSGCYSGWPCPCTVFHQQRQLSRAPSTWSPHHTWVKALPSRVPRISHHLPSRLSAPWLFPHHDSLSQKTSGFLFPSPNCLQAFWSLLFWKHSQKWCRRTDFWLPRVLEDGEGKEWEFGISRGKLIYIGWINNKVLLYSTGNYMQ